VIQRLIRIAGSFACVLAAYWLYALVVVPLVEPVADRRAVAGTHVSQADRDQARSAVEGQRAELLTWFSKGDWELTSPIILETSHGTLLLREYDNTLGDHRVKIRPCTMIIMPSGGPEDEAQRRRRALVLQAPDGAVLQFNSDFKPKQGSFGKLVGGRLLGPIIIRSDQREPGPDDDLLINTHDVELVEDRIWTPNEVTFRMGANWGQGQHLVINLRPGDSLRPNTTLGPTFDGVSSLKLAHDVQMHIVPGESDMFPGGRRAASRDADGPAARPRAPQPPVDVSCRGMFAFDLEEFVMSFEEHVDVLRVHPQGPSDQISCERLQVYFEPERNGEEPTTPSSGIPKLEPIRMSASGSPVVVLAPSNRAEARGENLHYDIRTGAIELSDAQTARFTHERHVLEAPYLKFQPDADRNLGTFLATGAGWVRGDVPDDPSRTFSARWSRQIYFRPHEAQHVLSIEGTAYVEVEGRGNLQAEEIHLWLNELAGGDTSGHGTQLLPDRMFAVTDVLIDSPQLTGAVSELQLWFEHVLEAPTVAQLGPALSVTTTPPAAAATGPVLPLANGSRLTPPVGATPTPTKVTVSRPPPAYLAQPADTTRRFHIDSDLLQAEMLVTNGKAELSQVMAEGRVRLKETQTLHPEEIPFVLEGDQLHMTQHGTQGGVGTVVGQPAVVDARGITLLGGAIHLDRGQNRLWVDGPGQMTLPVRGDVNLIGGSTRPSAMKGGQEHPLQIDWRGGMNFDGRTAVFQETVHARHERQVETKLDLLNVDANRLEVTLNRQVQFATTDDAGKLNVAELACFGNVFVENRSFLANQPNGLSRLRAVNLAVDQRTNDVRGQGPGIVTLWNRGGTDMLPTTGPAARTPQPNAREATEQDEGFAFVNIEFESALAGNLARREMTFENQVRATYGRVESWETRLDPTRPEQLGPKGAVLTCERMTLAESGTSASGRAQYEMAATGNASVEGNTFRALGERITYSTAKDMLVLEGDGRADAALYRQVNPRVRAAEAHARKISYWRSRDHVQVEGARYLDLGDGNAALPKSTR